MVDFLNDAYEVLVVVTAGITVGALSYLKGKKNCKNTNPEYDGDTPMKLADDIYTRKEIFEVVTENLEKEVQEIKQELKEVRAENRQDNSNIMITLNIILDKLSNIK